MSNYKPKNGLIWGCRKSGNHAYEDLTKSGHKMDIKEIIIIYIFGYTIIPNVEI